MNDPYFGGACLIGVFYDIKTKEHKYVLVKSKRKGKWIFPKGSIKAAESERCYSAAIREGREEAGIITNEVSVNDVDPIGAYEHAKANCHSVCRCSR